jgi:2-pyrone-4,6-dicarboxylate lactonase
MTTAGEKIYEWDRHPRMPVPPPPPGSCDCQFHIYEEASKFPPRANPPYPTIESATFTAAQNMHKAIGFERGVIVHSAIYGSDHHLLLNALASVDDPGRYRGIAIVDDSVSDNELARLHAAGVRGARFNFVRFLTLDQREAEVRRSMTRIRELGWHARLHVHGDDLLNNSDLLRSIKDLPMVIDHFGHVGFEGGFERPVIRWVLDMLKHEN